MFFIIRRLTENRDATRLKESLLEQRRKEKEEYKNKLKEVRKTTGKITAWTVGQKQKTMGLFADTYNNGANNETTTQDTFEPEPRR